MLTATLLVLVAASPVYADEVLIWDNYPGDVLENAAYNMSSERNTQVVEATWVVDDVDFAQIPGGDPDLTMLTRLEWIGARGLGVTYSTADVILLNRSGDDWNTVYESWDLVYTFTDIETDPDLGPDMQAYEAELTFGEAIPVSELGEHFYIGVRLVGDGYFVGRNHFVTSSIDQAVWGRTEGYIKADVFGAPDWTPASDVWYGADVPGSNFDFAFRVYGYVIPEPASLGLLMIGSLLLAARKR